MNATDPALVPPSSGPFRLIDRVLEVGPDRLVALKNVSLNEPYFAGHFPGRPLMPGVLICEALAQAGALLIRHIHATERPLVLAGLDGVRFRKPILPGQQVRLEVTLREHRRGGWLVHGRALVEGDIAAEGLLRLREGKT